MINRIITDISDYILSDDIPEYGIDRVLGELARCGNQLVGDIKDYLVI